MTTKFERRIMELKQRHDISRKEKENEKLKRLIEEKRERERFRKEQDFLKQIRQFGSMFAKMHVYDGSLTVPFQENLTLKFHAKSESSWWIMMMEGKDQLVCIKPHEMQTGYMVGRNMVSIRSEYWDEIIDAFDPECEYTLELDFEDALRELIDQRTKSLNEENRKLVKELEQLS